MGKFVITKRKNGEYQFNLHASNGQAILTSEGYTRRTNCHNGILSVKKNASNDARFERKKSKSGKFFFNLKAINGQVIGTSEMYEKEAACENGIKSVKENAEKATIEDKTA